METDATGSGATRTTQWDRALGQRWLWWFRAVHEPADAAGLAAFRILFGTLMALATARFAAKGWIAELYIQPDYHFPYWGFEWVVPWPSWGMYLHFVGMGLAAAALAVGLFTRTSAALFFLLFGYVELLDKSVYLNHYYLVSLLALLLVFLPSATCWSLDARLAKRQPREARAASLVPRGGYWLLRAQMAIVYCFAGFAKLNADWLLHAQPLKLWLQAYQDVALIGPMLSQAWTAHAMSWAGALYDLSVAGFLLWRPTRKWAYLTALAFHVVVGLLFPIGIFPWVMLIAATVFFEPNWPRRVLAKVRSGFNAETPSAVGGRDDCERTRRQRVTGWAVALGGAYLAWQLLMPLRYLLYPGWVNWTEQGFRFAWRVMLIEKTGQVEFEVRANGRRFTVYPRRELTPLQYRMMSTQPDMIQDYARHLAERYRKQGASQVEVRAQAWAALNGRPSQRLIEPTADLASASGGLGSKSWIVPLSDARGLDDFVGRPVPPGATLGLRL